MNEEVGKQQTKMELASTEVARIRQEEQIVDLNPEGTEDQQAPVNTVIIKQEGEVNDAETKVTTLSSKLEQIEKLKGEELMRMLSTLDIQDPTIQKVLPNYHDAVAQEALLLNSGLGENHPKVKALRATKGVYTKQLEEQMSSIRGALEKNLKTAQATRDELKKRLEQINAKQLSNKNLSANYTRAKNAYIKEKLLFDGIRTRAQTQTMELAMPRMAVSVKQVAEPASAAARPRVGLNLMLGAMVGLVLGLGLAFFIEYLDTSVKTMEDVESLLGVPVLAIIPKEIRLLHKEAGDTPDAEAYRILRTNIEFNRKNPEANALSLVSGGPGEGKSTTIANLAFISAQGGYSTLIVDADLRRPVQHELFDVSNNIRADQLSHDRDGAGRSDLAHRGRESQRHAQRCSSVGRRRHSQFAAHVGHDCRVEIALRHDLVRFAADAWRERRIGSGQRSRSDDYRCPTPAFPARHAHARKASRARCGRNRFGRRA